MCPKINLDVEVGGFREQDFKYILEYFVYEFIDNKYNSLK